MEGKKRELCMVAIMAKDCRKGKGVNADRHLPLFLSVTSVCLTRW